MLIMSGVETFFSKNAYYNFLRKNKELISRDPTDCDVYYCLGLAFEKQEKLIEAEIQYKRVLKIDPYYNKSAHNLAIVLTKQGKYTEALEQYEKNIRETPDDSSNVSCYGYLKFILGKYEEAIESFEEAMRKDPNESMPVLNKSLTLYCLGRLEPAIEVFEEGLGKIGENEKWEARFEEDLGIYEGELRRFEETLGSGDLGEIPRETLVRNIKALCFIVDSFKRVLL